MPLILTTREFERAARKVGLTEREREAMILVLEGNPTVGDLIPKTGGARKVRVAKESSGKSGGYRVITYFGGGEMPVYLLDIYSKSSQADLDEGEKKELKAVCKAILKEHRSKKQ